MTSVHPPNPTEVTKSDSTTPDLGAKIGQGWGEKYTRFSAILLMVNAISASLFIIVMNHPVYDDPYNLTDVLRYAWQGVSANTIRSHVNPAGPTSFLWMAAAVRALGGDSLRDARVAILISWLILGMLILIGTRHSNFRHLWCGALMVTLVFPHTLTAMATVLTEGPAILFAMVGVLALVESAARPTSKARRALLGLGGGLSIGLAATCRQYYLALLPAAGLFAWFQERRAVSGTKAGWAREILPLMAALLPLIPLAFLWKGLSSPGMVTGASYAMWRSSVGLNLFRPAVVFFYTAVYLVPLTLPVILPQTAAFTSRSLLYSAIVGLGVGPFHSSLLQPGPVQSVVHVARRIPGGEFIFFTLIATVTAFNAIAFGQMLLQRRAAVFSCPPIAFAFFLVVFFIAEQAGIGGNIPFYDRYVLQIAPFLGLISFGLLPQLNRPRLSVLVCLSIVSQALLWRHALTMK